MKIMLVVTGLSVGGAERLVTHLVDAFAEVGHEVMLVWLGGPDELQPTDPRVEMVSLRMTRSPWSVLLGMCQLRRLIRKFAPDVVNSHLVHANMLARIIRVVAPIPRLVTSAHNSNEESRLRMLAYRLTDRLADISTNVAEGSVQAFIDQGAVRPGRMVAIDNGIDTRNFTFDPTARDQLRAELKLGAGASLLLAVGRLSAEKDYPNLLRAFARLGCSSLSPKLAIVGAGPLQSELERLADSLGVAERVWFLGIRHDVRGLMSAADVFVLSSAWEGLPIVLLEAMSCARTVVATDSGGVGEVLGDTGWLVPPRDSDALAEALAEALALPLGERTRYGELARARVVSQYSIDATVSRYLALFEASA